MVRLFLTTANVGSVFENIDKGLSPWFNEFTSVIGSNGPDFVAVHFQETGGKNYQNGSDVIERFFRELVRRMEMLDFRRAEGFVDSRSDLEDQFTALSSVFFVHERLQNVQIWDFQEGCFTDVCAKLHIGSDLELTRRKQKEKFPQDFFPNCKWSRKGFLRTRWRIEGATLDFVNIHLFHDSCNLIAASAYPSPFAQNREKTMKFVLNKLQNESLDKCPMYIFGDFNFRINSYEVLDRLRMETLKSSRLESELLVLESKKFECPDHELRFKENYHWLIPYDFEAKQLAGYLQEEELIFHPSYPFEEDESRAENFMRTRCPAWCDRVLYTPSAKDIMSQDSKEYNIIGTDVCMGDHKPVYLAFNFNIGEDKKPEEDNPANELTRGSSSSSSAAVEDGVGGGVDGQNGVDVPVSEVTAAAVAFSAQTQQEVEEE